MAILARVQKNGTLIPVEVCDTFTTSDGRKLAAVRAINGGKPFTTWTHGGPCPDDLATLRVDYLQDITVTGEDQPQAPNLFKRALDLAANKRQWYAGEVVYIWGDQKRGAFLAENGGIISLYVTGHRKPCRLFYLALDGWQIGEKAAELYGRWAAQAAEVVK
jgi:hypothetical protein